MLSFVVFQTSKNTFNLPRNLVYGDMEIVSEESNSSTDTLEHGAWLGCTTTQEHPRICTFIIGLEIQYYMREHYKG